MAVTTENNAFFKAIDDASREQTQSVMASMQLYKEQQLKAANETAQLKYDEYMKAAADRLLNDSRAKTERLSLEMRKEVTLYRAEITERVFSEVSKKLTAFTKTEEYTSLLENSIKAISEICKDSPFTVYIRSEDMHLADKLKALGSFNLEESSEIKLGGVFALCEEKSLRLDDTLEARLSQQRASFLESSGLSI